MKRILYLRLFLKIFLLYNSLVFIESKINEDQKVYVQISNLILNKTCNQINFIEKKDFTFGLGHNVTNMSIEIDPFEIEFKADYTINKALCIFEEPGIFLCTVNYNDLREGSYKIIQETEINLNNITISTFDFSSQKITLTIKNIYNYISNGNVVYTSKENKDYLNIKFDNNLDDVDSYPTIKLGRFILNCTKNNKISNILECEVNKDIYTPQKDYNLTIINVCGEIIIDKVNVRIYEADEELIVLNTQMDNSLTCGLINNEANFKITFSSLFNLKNTYLENCFIIMTENYEDPLNIKINSIEEESIIKTGYIINSPSLLNNNYYMYSSVNCLGNIKKENPYLLNYVIRPFIHFIFMPNLNYVKPKLYNLNYYKLWKESDLDPIVEKNNFIIEYESNLIESPNVFINEVQLNCDKNNNQAICYYSIEDLEPNSIKNKTYSGYVQNVCGQNEINIIFDVSFEKEKFPELLKDLKIKDINKCYKIEYQTKFQFEILYNSSYKGNINEFQIEFKGSNQIYQALCKSNKENSLVCTTEELPIDFELGGYYASLTNFITDKTNYFIKSFSLIEQKLYFSDKNVYTLYHDRKEYNYLISYLTYYLQYIYFDLKQDSQEDKLLPEIILDYLPLNCKINNSKIECQISRKDFALIKEYKGRMYDYCGLKMIDFKVQSSLNYIINIKDIDYKYKECSSLPKNTLIYFIFDGIEHVSAIHYINNELKLISFDDNEETIIYLNCTISEIDFYCFTTEDMIKEGNYYIFLEKPLYFLEYNINSFYSTTFIKGIKNSNDIDEENTFNIVDYDYNIKSEGSFEIIFKNELTKIYTTIINESNIELKCTYLNNTQTCFFNDTILPYDINNPDCPRSHLVKVINDCGNEYFPITIKVSKALTINVLSIEKEDPDEECSNFHIGSKFILKLDKQGLIDPEFITNKFYLNKNGSDTFIKIPLECHFDKRNSICQIIEQPKESGEYFISLDEDIQINTLKMKAFVYDVLYGFDPNQIEFINSTFYEYYNDYSKFPYNNFTLNFKNKVTGIPLIKDEDTDTILNNCKLNENKIICTYSINELPTDYENPTEYKAHVINVYNYCGNFLYFFYIYVKGTFSNRVSVYNITFYNNEEIEGKCSKLEKNTKLKLSTYNIQAIKQKTDLKDNNIYLIDNTTKINLNCEINNKEFTCISMEESINVEDGSYLFIIEKNIYLEDGIVILQANLSEKIIYVNTSESVPNITKEFKVEYNYKNGFDSEFIIPYNEPLLFLPEITIKGYGKPLDCEIELEKNNILKCYFDESRFSPNKTNPDQIKTYELSLRTSCNTERMKIPLNVYRTNVLVTIISDDLSNFNKCNKYSKGMSFYLSYDLEECPSTNKDIIQFTGSFQLLNGFSDQNITFTCLYDNTTEESYKNTIYKAKCQLFDDNLLIQGKYYLNMPFYKNITTYIDVNPYQSNKLIGFTNADYILPINSHLSFNFDYREISLIEFNIKFTKELTNETKPILEYNNHIIKCEINTVDTSKLNCKEDKNLFKLEENDKTSKKVYKIIFINVCGDIEEDINIYITIQYEDEGLKKSSKIIIIIASVLVCLLIIGIIIYIIIRKKNSEKKEEGDMPILPPREDSIK